MNILKSYFDSFDLDVKETYVLFYSSFEEGIIMETAESTLKEAITRHSHIRCVIQRYNCQGQALCEKLRQDSRYVSKCFLY